MKYLVPLGLLLCTCAHQPEAVSVSALVPPSLQVCPDGKPSPPPPPPPRSIKQVIDWSKQTYDALVRTEQARKVCSDRLSELNHWIEQYVPTKR